MAQKYYFYFIEWLKKCLYYECQRHFGIEERQQMIVEREKFQFLPPEIGHFRLERAMVKNHFLYILKDRRVPNITL